MSKVERAWHFFKGKNDWLSRVHICIFGGIRVEKRFGQNAEKTYCAPRHPGLIKCSMKDEQQQ